MFPDICVLAAHFAALTERIRFVFGALVIPLREPIALAKTLATLDQVSGGRISIVIGTGWLEAEFQALGVPFADRGRRTDEYLRVMRALWTQDEPAFSGEYVSFPPLHFEPRCVQVPHVPLWVGGTGAAPFRRLVEFGSGWCPMVGTFDEKAALIQTLKSKVSDAGRDPAGLAFVGSLTLGALDAESARLTRGHHATERDLVDARARTVEAYGAALDEIREHETAGFTHLGVNIGWETTDELVTKLEEFAARVIVPIREQSAATA